jgi:hypothetical protein
MKFDVAARRLQTSDFRLEVPVWFWPAEPQPDDEVDGGRLGAEIA